MGKLCNAVSLILDNWNKDKNKIAFSQHKGSASEFWQEIQAIITSRLNLLMTSADAKELIIIKHQLRIYVGTWWDSCHNKPYSQARPRISRLRSFEITGALSISYIRYNYLMQVNHWIHHATEEESFLCNRICCSICIPETVILTICWSYRVFQNGCAVDNFHLVWHKYNQNCTVYWQCVFRYFRLHLRRLTFSYWTITVCQNKKRNRSDGKRTWSILPFVNVYLTTK